MNAEKLAKLQSQVRIGGKGTARRKKKVVHRTATTDDKKLQTSLKKLTVNSIPGIEEVNMFRDDGTVIHFTNPKVQASLTANTFAVTGQSEVKQLSDMMPGILNQLRSENLNRWTDILANLTTGSGAGQPGNVSELLAAAAAAQQAATGENGPMPSVPGAGETIVEEDDEDIPELVQNFDEAAKIGEN